MSAWRGALVLAAAVAVVACATPPHVDAPPVAPAAAAPSPIAAAPPAAEPPRQVDALNRVASELNELQNAVAKLMQSARQHDDQLLYLQRRITELESQTRGRATAPPAFAPSAGMPAPLPPPPAAPLPPSVPAPRATLPPAGPAPSAVARATPPPRLPAPPSSAAPPANASPAETLYRSGLAKYKAGDLDGAVVSLYEVVVTFPADPARERAQFLVGEIFFTQKDYRGTIAELESMIAAVPAGSLVADALLKIGLAQRSLGDEPRARRAWERLVKDYPASAAARQARTLLRAAR